jgi:hypothetical protein
MENKEQLIEYLKGEIIELSKMILSNDAWERTCRSVKLIGIDGGKSDEKIQEYKNANMLNQKRIEKLREIVAEIEKDKLVI